MEIVTCPKCQGTEVYVSVPSPEQKKMGYVKTGNCTSDLGNELKCGYIYEMYDGNKPK